MNHHEVWQREMDSLAGEPTAAGIQAEKDANKCMWSEYDSAAEYVARYGKYLKPEFDGNWCTLLPDALNIQVYAEIENNPEGFALRVKDIAYATAMEKRASVDGSEAP